MATTKYQGFPTYRYAQIALKGSKKINQNRHYIESNPEEEQKPVSKEFHHSESGDNMRRRNKTGHTLANERPQQKQHQKKQQQQNAGSVSSKEELEVDYEHDVTELYQAISTSQWDFALETLKRNPHEARTWVVRYKEDDTKGIMWRFLPIHSACARQPPKPVIESLIQAYAKGAESCDDQGMYPLHYASGNQASAEVLWQLIQAFPHAANISDPNGMLPIHYMAQWGPSETKAIDALLFANQQTSVTDDHGNTPLHYAEEGDYPFRQEMIAALKRGPMMSSSSSNGGQGSKKKFFHQPTLPPMAASRGRNMNNNNDNNNPAATPANTVSGTRTSSSSNISKLDDASSQVSSHLPMKVVYKHPSDATINTIGNNTNGATSLPPSANKTVNRLTAQINKLKADLQFHTAEYEEELTNQREEHEQNIKEFNSKILKAIDDNANVKKDVASKVKYAEYVQGRTGEIEKEVSRYQEENEQLEKETAKHDEELRLEKSKVESFHLKIKSISSRMKVMIEDQKNIGSSLVSIEEAMKIASEQRKKKLQELYDEEMKYTNQLASFKQLYGAGGPTILSALNQQKDMMENCALVLKECEED